MTIDSSLLTYFLHAGVIVKLVMLLLMGASIASWTFILQRYFYLGSAKDHATQFENEFWVGGDLAKLHAEVCEEENEPTGLAGIFSAGFKEFLRLHKQPGIEATDVMAGAQRAMRVAETRELDKLEMHLPLLATVGSISPYVGLFGTVWGIMTSFNAMANVQQATIAMVAPGIAEALVATALGLFAAIPAVIAYNRYANDVARLQNRFSAFQEEFSSILYRQAQLSLNKVTG